MFRLWSVYPFYVVYVPGFEAETTTSCPDLPTAIEVIDLLAVGGPVPVMVPPGNIVPNDVAKHVVWL